MNPILSKLLLLLGLSLYQVNSFSIFEAVKKAFKVKDAPQKQLLTVGILTLPTGTNMLKHMSSSQYIWEMGDIWMREAGLNAVYIPYNATDEDLYPILDQINGVFFTGGSIDLYNYTTGVPHPYTVTAEKILNYSISHTDNGDYFPLLGICQGHQLLQLLVAKNTNAFGNSEFENKRINTVFVVDPRNQSKMLSTFSAEVLEEMATQDSLLHLHHHAIPLQDYQEFNSLSNFYRVLSINNINGQMIVSTTEAINYPVYTAQYHPEVVLEPASDINALRTPIGFKIAQAFTNFFASECNKNNHQFKDMNELEKLFVHNQKPEKAPFNTELVNLFGIEYN
ncbi:peptidase c26 family protein [Stylonychia lemnae]|uniref:folate gamma-glutamyl hydrolase n=1 Tax=Stylonychia lemnae TaxID=5949 RepID=A0A077ZRX0_STYLE|nr:peptidase c26 family protein [Stylonychia lemnae]|eukprot:CDW72622.1 peptidase c26 family protein [Stylonychia lemnae]